MGFAEASASQRAEVRNGVLPDGTLSADGNLEPGAALLEKPFSESALMEKLVEVSPPAACTPTR